MTPAKIEKTLLLPHYIEKINLSSSVTPTFNELYVAGRIYREFEKRQREKRKNRKNKEAFKNNFEQRKTK